MRTDVDGKKGGNLNMRTSTKKVTNYKKRQMSKIYQYKYSQ